MREGHLHESVGVRADLPAGPHSRYAEYMVREAQTCPLSSRRPIARRAARETQRERRTPGVVACGSSHRRCCSDWAGQRR